MAEHRLTADQCRIGRAALGLSEQDLADAAALEASDIVSMEEGLSLSASISTRIEMAFAAAGVTFHQGADGSARMKVRTLDGIIEAPVAMSLP